MSICLLIEVKWQWAMLVLGWVTVSVLHQLWGSSISWVSQQPCNWRSHSGTFSWLSRGIFNPRKLYVPLCFISLCRSLGFLVEVFKPWPLGVLTKSDRGINANSNLIWFFFQFLKFTHDFSACSHMICVSCLMRTCLQNCHCLNH